MSKRTLLSAVYNQRSIFDTLVSEKWYGGADLMKVDTKGEKILVLWGGEDIATSIYGEKPSTYCAKETPSYRDNVEMDLAKAAIEQKIPIIGVCRGAQMMCALSGGKLIQHVDNHFGDHDIMTSNGQRLETSSIHHQMLHLGEVDHEMLAWAAPKRATKYISEGNVDLAECHHAGFKEPEVVWIPGTRSLCIQGHPEYMSETTPFCKYVAELVEQFIYPLTHEALPNRG